jgi:hypothetical protein
MIGPGGATLAVAVGVVLGGIGAAVAHDAVLDEDRRQAVQRANETYQRRRWLPW